MNSSTYQPMNRPSRDADLARMVREALEQDFRFTVSTIEVAAKDGVVTLTGLVPDPAARASAIAIAERTRGVARVVDRIRVRPFVPRFDADVTADVVTAIVLDTAANPAKIDVETVDGVVYLRGTVPNPTIRQMVTSIARSVEGVKDVIDDLDVVVAVPHPDSEIAQAIEARWHATLRPEIADRVRVSVHDGVARIGGEVDTTATRWAIEDLARWVPGVLDVVDEMRGPED